MTPILKNYLFKLVLPNKQEYLENFKELIEEATKQTLGKLWTEEWIEKLGRTTIKAHCMVTAGRVILEQNGQEVYLPSRVRMGVAERVGRILRSQYKRMKCFYDCLKIFEIVGMNDSETKLIQLMNLNYQGKIKQPLYKKVLLKHTIRLIKNWKQNCHIDFHMVPYCTLVEPIIKRFVFLYSPDNYRELDYKVNNNQIWFRVRLPKTTASKNINDWEWVEGMIPIPIKIQERIDESVSQHPKKPKMITVILKGGIEQFFFSFPWEFKQKINEQKVRTRALAVDLGVKKIATAIVCEKKRQISKPFYVKLTSNQYQHIERLFKHLNGISKQTKVIPEEGKEKRQLEERARIYRKLAQIKVELVHTTTNILITKAKQWNCDRIILEDLRSFSPKKGRKKWSRQLNEWLRGQITNQLEDKGKEEGLLIKKVNPWGTSNHCARCANSKGQTITGANNVLQKKNGRWFYCPECGFTADRDYNAALNIYRASFINYRQIKSLKDTSPITYTEIGIPSPDCSWRRSRDELTTTQIVLVTGG